MANVTAVGHHENATPKSKAVRIVHISDTHLAHTSLTPPRPLSGNISIQRSTSTELPNSVLDESGKDAFASRSNPLIEAHEDIFSQCGSSLPRRSRTNKYEVPPGNVLVHSGDFDWAKESGGFLRSHNFEEIVQLMNDFFDRFPHKVKIFVAGNHDMALEGKKRLAVQERLTSAVYLCDSSFTYEGINFYGAPYTPFRLMTNARAFIATSREIAAHWRNIPSRTDVLITHTPPQGILDCTVTWTGKVALRLVRTVSSMLPMSDCDICHQQHPGQGHCGCRKLAKEVFIRIKPTLHLFGHCHACFGVRKRKGITFSNAAFPVAKEPQVFDYYLPPS